MSEALGRAWMILPALMTGDWDTVPVTGWAEDTYMLFIPW